MMKRLLIGCFLFGCTSVFSQVKCYKGDFLGSTELRYRIENNQLYLQTATFREVEYYFVNGSVIFFGRLGDLQNPVYTICNNEIYKGNSTMSTDLLYTIYNNGIYLGRSTVSSDCLFSFKDGKIYRGNSDSSFDLLMTCDKSTLTNNELYLLMAAILPY
jgi:hypothetical protein